MKYIIVQVELTAAGVPTTTILGYYIPSSNFNFGSDINTAVIFDTRRDARYVLAQIIQSDVDSEFQIRAVTQTLALVP